MKYLDIEFDLKTGDISIEGRCPVDDLPNPEEYRFVKAATGNSTLYKIQEESLSCHDMKYNRMLLCAF